MAELFLITGGARSGKSKFAAELASRISNKVTFIATASEFSDPEMKKRIKLHQESRPCNWDTIEEPEDIGPLLSRINCPERVILIDCLTLLVSNLLLKEEKEKEICDRIQVVARNAKKYNRATIVVTNEVGWGVIPSTPMGRKFRDLAGKANQILAREANRVWLMVAGIPLSVKGDNM